MPDGNTGAYDNALAVVQKDPAAFEVDVRPLHTTKGSALFGLLAAKTNALLVDLTGRPSALQLVMLLMPLVTRLCKVKMPTIMSSHQHLLLLPTDSLGVFSCHVFIEIAGSGRH